MISTRLLNILGNDSDESKATILPVRCSEASVSHKPPMLKSSLDSVNRFLLRLIGIHSLCSGGELSLQVKWTRTKLILTQLSWLQALASERKLKYNFSALTHICLGLPDSQILRPYKRYMAYHHFPISAFAKNLWKQISLRHQLSYPFVHY